MKLLISLLLVASAFAQNWANLGAGSQLWPVAPQNCTNTASPPYCLNVSFAYNDNFFQMLSAWGSAVARTKAGSEQLVFFGGGHVATLDNSLYTVNLYTTPASVTALGFPSIPYGTTSPVMALTTTMAPNADGKPLSQHSYENSTYLPVHDEMFFWAQGGSNYRANRSPPFVDRLTWTYKFSNDTWTNMLPTGYDVTPSGTFATDQSGAAYCTLDTTGVSTHERVFCIWGWGGSPYVLLLYDRDANSWQALLGFGGLPFTFGGSSVKVDPVRKLLVSFGPTQDNGTGGLQVIKVDISGSPWTVTDLSGSLPGCSALASVTHPGMEYYPTTADFVIYPGSGNIVYHFNPVTAICSPQTISGGPTGTVSGSGQWGKFNFFPGLNRFVNVTSTTTNAFSLDLGTPPAITSSATLTAGTQNVAYTFTPTATGTTPITWSISSGSAPIGISINSSTGTLSGTPINSGSFSFDVTANNGFGSPAVQHATLSIAAVCLITSATLASGKFNQPYSQTVTTAGCSGSQTFAKTTGSLPTGLSLNTATGVISGTPTASGLFSFTIGITDSAGNPTQAFGLTIVPGPGVFGAPVGPRFVLR